MITLEFHDPCGRLEATQPFAPRLHSLEGKRLAFVSGPLPRGVASNASDRLRHSVG